MFVSYVRFFFFFFNDTATTEIYTLSLHDALPILSLFAAPPWQSLPVLRHGAGGDRTDLVCGYLRSEEHTSELQSRENLVCRLLLEKKKKTRQEMRLKRKEETNQSA